MALPDLRGILQYVPQFRGETFVVAVDGGVIAAGGLPNIGLDLAVLQSLNIGVVFVHGARAQIRSLAATQGVAISNDDGCGVTDADTLELATSAVARLSSDIMREFTAAGLRVAHANAVTARGAGIVDGTERLHTGRIDRIDAEAIQALVTQEMLPVIAPIGYDRSGQAFRLNSDRTAVEVATAIGASKILFLSDDPPEIDPAPGQGESTRQFPSTRALELARDGESLAAGLRCKLENAARACEKGIARVHLLDGTIDEALLGEIFSREGVGVMVHADAYLRIRPAEPRDIPAMVAMMRVAVEDGGLLPRDTATLEGMIGDFLVVDIDGTLVGCVAIHTYGEPPDRLCELACLCVSPSHAAQGYGTQLVSAAIDHARASEASQLFALSTQAYGYLREKGGFEDAPGDFVLPESRRTLVEASGRNARVLVRGL